MISPPKVCASLTSLNLIDQPSGDGPDSIRRAVHPLCWRCVLLCGGTGLHGDCQNSQARPAAGASRADHRVQAKAIIRVCSRSSRFHRAHIQHRAPRMPSTHSATITFYGAYITMACAWLPLHHSLPESALFRPLTTLVGVSWAFIVPGSRIWLGHHTIAQVVVGCAYGFTFACLWFSLWTLGLSALGEIVEDHVRAYIG
jgi:membrane-associated phospholipid phosphatase